MAKNTAQEELAPAAEAQAVHIDDFLANVRDVSPVMKAMFHHFTTKVQQETHKTVAEFEALLEEFKNLPASKLK